MKYLRDESGEILVILGAAAARIEIISETSTVEFPRSRKAPISVDSLMARPIVLNCEAEQRYVSER